MFIQRHGKIPDATAKHFMQQLGKFYKIVLPCSLFGFDNRHCNCILTLECFSML